MKLSVIICTYNRAQYIGPLLESLVANDLPKSEYEIIVVDNNCTDNTCEVCHAFAQAHADVALKYLVEKEQGISAARNKGMSDATGDVFVYVDDDALVDTHYLSDYALWFEQHPETMAAGGPIEPLYEGFEEPEWMTPMIRTVLTACMNFGESIREYPYRHYPGGGNAAIRREVFEMIGNFNTSLGRKGDNLMGSEEKDIYEKMHTAQMQIMYLPEPVLHHIIPEYKMSKEYFNRLTVQMGRSEHERTNARGDFAYTVRVFSELYRWLEAFGSVIKYTCIGHPSKGLKLLSFRAHVSRGLFFG